MVFIPKAIAMLGRGMGVHDKSDPDAGGAGDNEGSASASP